MNTHSICFYGKLRKNINSFGFEKMAYVEL